MRRNNKPLAQTSRHNSRPSPSSSSPSPPFGLCKMIYSTIVAFFAWLLREFVSFWHSYTGQTISFTDTGRTVRMGRQIAEGGFSYVFEATEVGTTRRQKNKKKGKHNKKRKTMYALKRIVCPESEILQGCEQEAAVHRAVHHPNLMPLLGMTIENKSSQQNSPSLCYMLFPLYSHSLRHEVNRRTLDRPMFHQNTSARSTTSTSTSTNRSSHSSALPAPWSELQALQICSQVVSGVQALHAAGYSHRDIKLENVLLSTDNNNNNNHRSHHHHHQQQHHQFQPVLMDFGSAGPLKVALHSRRDVLMAIENAAMHTTLPYRPPELLEAGGVRQGDAPLDYAAVDVWSLGCFMFAVLYGASPKECEFTTTSSSSSSSSQHNQSSSAACGFLQIVECTPLRILNDRLPTPPPNSDAATWYSDDLLALIGSMLNQNRHDRPSLSFVQETLVQLITKLGGKPPQASSTDYYSDDDDNDNDFHDIGLDDQDHDAAAEMSLISHRV